MKTLQNIAAVVIMAAMLALLGYSFACIKTTDTAYGQKNVCHDGIIHS